MTVDVTREILAKRLRREATAALCYRPVCAVPRRRVAQRGVGEALVLALALALALVLVLVRGGGRLSHAS